MPPLLLLPAPYYQLLRFVSQALYSLSLSAPGSGIFLAYTSVGRATNREREKTEQASRFSALLRIKMFVGNVERRAETSQ